MQAAIILCVSTVVTLFSVRLLVIRGIEEICNAWSLSSKTKGQIIGYATSTPELVVIVASALSGVFEAGFWNIASSNVINCVLFVLAVLVYRQQRELFDRAFVDEVLFGAVSVAVPIVLFGLDVSLTAGVSVGLIGFFVFYKVIDKVTNPRATAADDTEESLPGSVGKGLFLLVAGLLTVLVAGRFLGRSAGVLVRELGLPAWLIGWILGMITSVPELTSFFDIYRLSRSRGKLHLTRDTQECMDALVASNMSNLGIILPVGALVFLWFSR